MPILRLFALVLGALLYRGANWRVIQNSNTYEQEDAQTIEFRVPVAPDEEKTITYRVRYMW